MNKIHIPIEPAEPNSVKPIRVANTPVAAPVKKKTVARWPAAVIGILLPITIGILYIYTPSQSLRGSIVQKASHSTIQILETGIVPQTMYSAAGQTVQFKNMTDATVTIDLGDACQGDCIITVPAKQSYHFTLESLDSGRMYFATIGTDIFEGFILPPNHQAYQSNLAN